MRFFSPFQADFPIRPIESGCRFAGILRLAVVLIFSTTLFVPKQSFGYSSEDPKIKSMVDKGIQFLEGLSEKEIKENQWGGEEYHIVLMAYAHFKAKHDPDNKIVRAGIRQAERTAASLRNARGLGGEPGAMNKTVYEVSISILLLCEVDAKKYLKQIELMRDSLFSVQKPHGGFGYPGEDQGDTSQIQYVVLAMWTMDQKGIEVPEKLVNEVQTYLMRVQDAGGAWPYRANDPGPGKGLIQQGTQYMSHSTALAGGSSILIAGDYFQLWREKKRENAIPTGIPEAIFLEGEVPLPGPERRQAAQVEQAPILTAVDLMNSYRNKNPYKRAGSTTWHYYSIYSIERFESFYEFALGKMQYEPAWYNSIVDDLMSNQSANGGWGIKDPAASPPAVATSFAILFLVRSTLQAIEQSQEGTLAGGFGLPGDTTKIRVDGTQIKGEPVAGAVTDLLDMLEGGDGDALEGKSLPEDMELPTEPKARKATIDRLERLVRGSSSWQARRVAAKLLGQSDEIRVVPSLIYALDDPDTVVRTFARDGLRFISRKFEGFAMVIQPGDKQDYGALRKAQRLWREWYLTMDPGYIFVAQ